MKRSKSNLWKNYTSVYLLVIFQTKDIQLVNVNDDNNPVYTKTFSPDNEEENRYLYNDRRCHKIIENRRIFNNNR